MTLATRTARASVLALTAVFGLLLAAPIHAADASGPSGVVNINTATSEQLQLLPGIGEARARAVIELRKKNGGFKSVDELSQVKGIGSSAVERLRPYVRTEGKTTASGR